MKHTGTHARAAGHFFFMGEGGLQLCRYERKTAIDVQNAVGRCEPSNLCSSQRQQRTFWRYGGEEGVEEGEAKK